MTAHSQTTSEATTLRHDRNRIDTGPTRVLCFASYFLPGFRFGGPMRSLLNLFERLSAEYKIGFVTRDHDLGDPNSYPNVRTGTWSDVSEMEVWYIGQPSWRPAALRAAVASYRPDILYFNSALDFSLTIVPLLLMRLQLMKAIPAIVAPRGEFAPAALGIKPIRKRLFFLVARGIGLYRSVLWQATKEEEITQIKRVWGPESRVLLAPNLSSLHATESMPRRQRKRADMLRLAFLGRIARMKNLDGAIRMLAGVKASIALDVYGIPEDQTYWAECQALIATLPANVHLNYMGPLSPTDVIATLAGYDAFFLPTLGENFGHAIHEALLAGCPVLISDRTPWRGLEAACAGFDLPLDSPELFRDAIERLAAMPPDEHDTWSRAARTLGLRYAHADELVDRTRQLLKDATK